MCSIHARFQVFQSQWGRRKNTRSVFLLNPNTKFAFFPRAISSSSSSSDNNDGSVSSSRQNNRQMGYDPSEELFGVDFKPRNVSDDSREPRSWFGPNGQYIRELPCPTCRGRGYTSCSKCGIERSRLDCPQCKGKGIMTCLRCLGDCVIWEESIDERPWEKARSSSPFRVKEDDDVDNLEIKFSKRTKSKRVYQSPPPEVGQKISRSLKSLNAKTGLFSKRMKIIHRDPVLHAQRVAAIKKAKGTPAARKHASEVMKTFFSNPENREQRSLSMKEFDFAPGRHDVAVVTQAAFENCEKEKPISLMSVPPVKIRLNTTGPQYFICTIGDHCRFGQKLSINVVGAGATGGAPPRAGGGASPAPAGSTPGVTTPPTAGTTTPSGSSGTTTPAGSGASSLGGATFLVAFVSAVVALF